MMVVVEETGDVYVLLSDAKGVHDLKNWKRIGADEVVGIEQISVPENPGIPGSIDSYQIILTNGDVFDFNIYNGADGADGITPKIKIDDGF
jgi:hypothetical protein